MSSINKEWVENHIDSNGEVIIPEGIEKIEPEAFKDNELVRKVIMPDSITEIGDNAFSGCSNLQNIRFSNNLKSIGEDSFLNCKKITHVELPKSIETIKEEAFACCESLERFLIDQQAKIDELQATVFYQCRNLSEVVLPKTIRSIGEFTFAECEKLSEDIFSYLSELETIKEGAFVQCQSLGNINIPASVQSIEKAAFMNCSNLRNVDFNVRSEIKMIGDQVFQNCGMLEEMQLPEKIEGIGMLAYAGCVNLTNITLGENIKVLGERAFCECERLKGITIPDSLKRIERGTFYKCSNLENINLGEGIEEIGRSSFNACENLEMVFLPDSLKKVEVAAFIDCSKLANINGGNNIEYIEPGAFVNVGIKSFKVPQKVKDVENILMNCSALEELHLGEETEKIISGAVKGCTNLRKLVINDKLKCLPEMTLEDCKQLEEVEINGNQRIHYGSFKGKDSIRKITIDGKEFLLEEDEQLFSLQRHNQNVAIVVKDKDGALRTRCINMEKGTETKQDVNIYLANDGSVVRSVNSLTNISLDQLKLLKERGEKRLYLYGAIRDIKPPEIEKGVEYDLYSIDDLIQIKTIMKEIKKEIVIPSKEDKHRQKKIYSQIVRKLSEKMEYDFYEEYQRANSEQEKEAEKIKYEKMTGKSWDEYLEQNKEVDIEKTMLEDGNLLGLLNGKAVCRGNVEIIRNLAAEFGIEVTAIVGLKHTWNQVKLDGLWYDDDFTNYQSYLAQGDLDKSSKRFLCGQVNGKSIFAGLKTYSKTLNQPTNVGKNYSLEDKKFLLNYGQVKQQTLQPQEKVKPQEKSIKDEVGDELKPKTEQQKYEEQQVETMWQNRFQSWDRDTAVLPDGAKKKTEAIQVMQDLQRQQDREKQNQEQLENQANEQR